MNHQFRSLTALALVSLSVAACSAADRPAEAPAGVSKAGVVPALSGAIFTTLVDGSRVNQNLYQAKTDVYLDGGPGPNAPVGAAGLPEGLYYYQVTDPSGKDLLSSDHISCRKVHINAKGVIDQVPPGDNYEWAAGEYKKVACQHKLGTDKDHAADGAVTVQLFPYDDTPNPGGVYKVWLTPVGSYTGNANLVPVRKKDSVNGELWQAGNAHGFVPAASKTDNFKVKIKGPPCNSPQITLKKFHDADLDGTQDAGEAGVEGWRMTVTDPVGSGNDYFTTASVLAFPGAWTVTEDQPAGTRPTASYLDGQRQSVFPTAVKTVSVTVANDCSGETHEVLFGDVGVGEVKACKVYDRDGDGVVDEGEPRVAGWKMTLTGTTVAGVAIDPLNGVTDASGCAVFSSLVPGTYTVAELVPPAGGWAATGKLEQTATITSTLTGAVISGSSVETPFTNVCTGTADFGTKGYWHNKNGLAEITAEDIAYINGLDPYKAPSSYFGAGDEPFDGKLTNGNPVPASKGPAGETLAEAGTAQAEISAFLVDANATGDAREQLAQQLLAFILNARHRLDDPAAAIKLPDGKFESAASLIARAVQLWSTGTDADRRTLEKLLDGLNNGDAVPFVHWNPCAVTYP